MLAVADHWLRKELEENRRLKIFENAKNSHGLDPTDRQGGYASGRNIPLEVTEKREKRQGRLSDMMGNAGVLSKHK
jgi:CCR4-NOT complex subunit CAF16